MRATGKNKRSERLSPRLHARSAEMILPADPGYRRLIRWIIILCGLAVFLWLAPEDNTVTPAVILGTVLASVLVLRWGYLRLSGQMLTRRYFCAALTLGGAFAGLSSSLLTVLLMVVKDAMHSHLYPDFSLNLMGAVLARAPIWMIAGGLTGAGLAFAWLAMKAKGSWS